MRIIRIFLITAVILWLVPKTSLAESPLSPLDLRFGKINPNPLVRAVTKNGATYVNLPFLYSYLNIVATRNLQSREVFLKFGKLSIKLYTDLPAYYLNGKKFSLDLSPFEADEQLWLPLEFILKLGITMKSSQQNKLDLDWEQNYLLSMESVQYQNRPAILLIGSQKLEVRQLQNQPNGFSFELAGASKHFAFDEQPKNASGVGGVRLEQNNEHLKVTFEFKEDLHYEFIPDPEQANRLLIVFKHPVETQTADPRDGENNRNEEPKITGSTPKKTPLKGKTIVLDPGHGGEDFGACGRQGIQEKDHNLEIALRLKDYLEDSGADVILTRTEDVYISLYERAHFANDTGADLFVSIHTNNHPDLSVRGIEVFSHRERAVAKILAQNVITRMAQATGFKKLGAKEANFVVIRETQMPGILVEVGFVSNYQEEQIMRTPKFKDEAASGIYWGIRDFYPK